MIYTAAWIFLFFGFAYPVLMSDKEQEKEHTPEHEPAHELEQGAAPSAPSAPAKSLSVTAGKTPLWEIVWRRAKMVLNGPIIGTAVGFAAGLIPEVQAALFSGPLVWLSSSAKTLGAPVVGLSALIVGATLGQTILRIANKNPRIGRFCKRLWCNVQPPQPVLAVNAAVGFEDTKATTVPPPAPEDENAVAKSDAVVVVFGSASEDTDNEDDGSPVSSVFAAAAAA
eukprot:gene29421-14561_t